MVSLGSINGGCHAQCGFSFKCIDVGHASRLLGWIKLAGEWLACKETNQLNHGTPRTRRTWRNLAAQGESKMSMILNSVPGLVTTRQGLAKSSVSTASPWLGRFLASLF
jgi:hypothetical protein